MAKRRVDACQICDVKEGIGPKFMEVVNSDIRTLVLCDRCYDKIKNGELVIRVIKK